MPLGAIFLFLPTEVKKQNVTPRAKSQREYSSNNLRCDNTSYEKKQEIA
jgi:hypothetical protein